MRWNLLIWLCLAGAVACQKEEQLYEPSDPRPAKPTAEAQVETLSYQIAAGSIIRFELRGKDVQTKGTLPVVRGVVQVQLDALSRTTGQIEADVGSLRLASFDDEAENRLQAERARNWLNLGASRPEAAREQARFARFTLSGFEGVSAESAFAGKRSALSLGGQPSASAPPTSAPRPPTRPTAIVPPGPGLDIELPEPEDEGAADASPQAAARSAPEARQVRATSNGQLQLNQFRKAMTAELELVFEFPERAGPGVKPTRIRVTSVKPLRVNLADHGIQPRDAHGVVDVAQAELLRRAGSEARVNVELILEPK